jgi:hypothetical protein
MAGPNGQECWKCLKWKPTLGNPPTEGECKATAGSLRLAENVAQEMVDQLVVPTLADAYASPLAWFSPLRRFDDYCHEFEAKPQP